MVQPCGMFFREYDMSKTLGALLAMVLLLVGSGCQMTPTHQAPASQPRYSELPPVPDRLRAFYQELQTNRFEVLADLEQAPQAQLFHMHGPGTAALTVRKSRLATGAGALEARFDSPASVLLIDEDFAKDWALPRMWQPYQIFIASVYSPVPAAASLQIRSGREQPAAWDSPLLPLRPGWNLLRIDLADVARQADLTDIRQIRMNVQARAWPYTCYLDDLLLADNSTIAYGDPAGPEGSLYVLRKGRRIHVGAVKQFELVFRRGVLGSWYDLSADPDKVIDLAGGGPAGPVLTALDETGTPAGGPGTDSWRRLGRSVQTQQQIVEMNPLAVTIRGTIRFDADAADDVESETSSAGDASPLSTQAATQPDDSPIEHTYLYTIRRDGRIFLDIQARIATESFTPAGIGLTVSTLHSVLQPRQIDPLDRSMIGDSQTEAGPTSATATAPATAPAIEPEPARAMVGAQGSMPIPRALLLARSRTAGTSLLLAPSTVAPYERVLSAIRQTGDVAAHMYVMPTPPSDNIHLAAMLAVWPPDLKDIPTAAAVARDYQEPTAPHVIVGKLHRGTDGDLDGDGFAEARGRWVLEPDGQVLRLRWPAGQLRFWPMLEVAGIDGKACWPYLDGRIIKPVEKAPSGSALFVVPEILSRAALLEVTVER